MSWSATETSTQLNIKNGASTLDVTVSLDNGAGIAIAVVITLNSGEDRQALKQKIQSITDGIDNLTIVQGDLKTTPQIDTSPVIFSDIQTQLMTEFNILNQFQSLVKLGKIAPDDVAVTNQIQKFADIANKIIKSDSATSFSATR